ncbi:hypothetical protein BDZ91DRAFT_734250 [Kalaharituber pfeilii]|nr:hypothetical protein BDZ91DRAFT_734250 [Kalaharituber pfeilii]
MQKGKKIRKSLSAFLLYYSHTSLLPLKRRKEKEKQKIRKPSPTLRGALNSLEGWIRERDKNTPSQCYSRAYSKSG